MTHVGFTGTQVGMNNFQKKAVSDRLMELRMQGQDPMYFHHGDCIGADAEAAEIASMLGYRLVMHPPLNQSKRAFTKAEEIRPPRESLKRNHDIVKETSVLVAAPSQSTEVLRSGTWATIRYARRLGRPIHLIAP